MTALGLGDSNLLGVDLDQNGRQSMDHLRTRLDWCLDTRTPVIMVVAVMGTTEEGAIDPLTDIIMMRSEYKGPTVITIHVQAGKSFVPQIEQLNSALPAN